MKLNVKLLITFQIRVCCRIFCIFLAKVKSRKCRPRFEETWWRPSGGPTSTNPNRRPVRSWWERLGDWFSRPISTRETIGSSRRRSSNTGNRFSIWAEASTCPLLVLSTTRFPDRKSISFWPQLRPGFTSFWVARGTPRTDPFCNRFNFIRFNLSSFWLFFH